MKSHAQSAVVTGAGSGIGRQAALALLAEGFSVALAGRHSETLEETAVMAGDAGVGDASGRALGWVTDVADAESVAALFAKTKEAFGRLDLLFNNAGISAPAIPLEDITPAQWTAVVAVNLTGAFLCTQEAFRLMKDQRPRGGRIINNGSISADRPRPDSAPYTATRHAITGLTKSTDLDGRKYDNDCGQNDTGNTATEMTPAMARASAEAAGAGASQRSSSPSEAGLAIIFMASLPLDANVQFMTIMATKMPYIGRG